MRKFTAVILLLFLALTLVAGCSRNAPPNVPDPSETDPPVTEPVVQEPELPRAFMVMIDNQAKARPQHGLAMADVVYEFISEVGITRMMAAFYSRDPGFVGPVRSIRYYYLHVAKAYDLPLCHVGGGMNALALREPLGIKSVCAITNAGAAFYVDPKRSAPHSTYIKSESLLSVASRRGYAATGLPELPQGDFAGTQDVTEVEITYSSVYRAGWVYQPEAGHYSRMVNGAPHPAAEQEEIVAGTVILIEAAVKTVTVPVNGVQSEVNLIGEGKATFLRDGKLATGKWIKKSPESHFKYVLDDGSELKYAPGNVWIQHVHSLEKNVMFK